MKNILFLFYSFSEGQETGAIAPAPENACKKFEGRGRSSLLKKHFFKLFLGENNHLNHFIHFQLQNNAPYALKLHLK
jgi:hypothetical protein